MFLHKAVTKSFEVKFSQDTAKYGTLPGNRMDLCTGNVLCSLSLPDLAQSSDTVYPPHDVARWSSCSCLPASLSIGYGSCKISPEQQWEKEFATFVNHSRRRRQNSYKTSNPPVLADKNGFYTQTLKDARTTSEGVSSNRYHCSRDAVTSTPVGRMLKNSTKNCTPGNGSTSRKFLQCVPNRAANIVQQFILCWS